QIEDGRRRRGGDLPRRKPCGHEVVERPAMTVPALEDAPLASEVAEILVSPGPEHAGVPQHGRQRPRGAPPDGSARGSHDSWRCPPRSCSRRGTTVHRVFLLSPAACSGKRAALVVHERAQLDLALRLRSPDGAPLGEVFTFLSGLYFRGKLAYAHAFAQAPAGLPGVLVITTSRGLVPPEQRVTIDDLREFAGVDLDARNPRYCL